MNGIINEVCAAREGKGESGRVRLLYYPEGLLVCARRTQYNDLLVLVLCYPIWRVQRDMFYDHPTN